MIDVSTFENRDDFIRAVAEDCLSNMSDDDKDYIRRHPCAGEYHFGYALYIRNHYIHGKDLRFFAFDADGLSSDIMKCIIEILLPGEYYANDEFIEDLFDSFEFPHLRNEYIRIYGSNPIDIVIPYRDEYERAMRPVREKDRKRKEEEDALRDAQFDDLFEKALIKCREEYSDSGMSEDEIRIHALVDVDMTFDHGRIKDFVEEKCEILRDIKGRLIKDIANRVWRKDKIRKQASKAGIPSEILEPYISEIENVLFENYEYVPMESVFLKLKNYIEDEVYNNAKKHLISAIDDNWRIVRSMDPSWFDDRDIAKAILKDGIMLRELPQFQDDEEMVRYALERNGDQIVVVSERLRKRRDIVKLAISHSPKYSIMQNSCMEQYRSDKELVYLACKTNRRNLMFVDPIFQDDYELAKQLVPLNQLESAYWGMSERLRDDLSLALLDIGTNSPCVQQYSERLKDSDEIAERLIAVHGKNYEQLQYMSERIRKKYHYTARDKEEGNYA